MPATNYKDTPPASRLVIRVTLSSDEPVPEPPAPQGLSKGAVLLIVGVVALLLGWLGISLFRSEPTPPTASTSAAASPAPTVRTEEAPAVSAQPVPPEVQPQPDAPLSPVNQVTPDVPQSALDTIRGTIRVSVRVVIDKQGAVVEATPQERGPSRYFERLSLEAAKKWTFTPASQEEQRTVLLKFNFTRFGAKAESTSATQAGQ